MDGHRQLESYRLPRHKPHRTSNNHYGEGGVPPGATTAPLSSDFRASVQSHMGMYFEGHSFRWEQDRLLPLNRTRPLRSFPDTCIARKVLAPRIVRPYRSSSIEFFDWHRPTFAEKV